MMKKHTSITPSIKQSMVAALLLAFTLTGFIACSDMTSDGITTTEVKKIQKKAANQPSMISFSSDDALLVINGEIMNTKAERQKVTRLKTKYIKSIGVLKGKSAINAYGEAGKNGVIKIQVYNKEKALSDLKSLQEVKNADFNTSGMKVYMAAQHMPELKNQKAFYSSFKYPKNCKMAGIEGTVLVQFVVTKTGEVTNAEVIKGISQACNQAALTLVKKHANFTPGTQDGNPVNVQMVLPIMYKQK